MKKKFVILLSISLIVLSQDGRSICAVISHHEGFRPGLYTIAGSCDPACSTVFPETYVQKGSALYWRISDYV